MAILTSGSSRVLVWTEWMGLATGDAATTMCVCGCVRLCRLTRGRVGNVSSRRGCGTHQPCLPMWPDYWYLVSVSWPARQSTAGARSCESKYTTCLYSEYICTESTDLALALLPELTNSSQAGGVDQPPIVASKPAAMFASHERTVQCMLRYHSVRRYSYPASCGVSSRLPRRKTSRLNIPSTSHLAR